MDITSKSLKLPRERTIRLGTGYLTQRWDRRNKKKTGACGTKEIMLKARLHIRLMLRIYVHVLKCTRSKFWGNDDDDGHIFTISTAMITISNVIGTKTSVVFSQGQTLYFQPCRGSSPFLRVLCRLSFLNIEALDVVGNSFTGWMSLVWSHDQNLYPEGCRVHRIEAFGQVGKFILPRENLWALNNDDFSLSWVEACFHILYRKRNKD